MRLAFLDAGRPERHDRRTVQVWPLHRSVARQNDSYRPVVTTDSRQLHGPAGFGFNPDHGHRPERCCKGTKLDPGAVIQCIGVDVESPVAEHPSYRAEHGSAAAPPRPTHDDRTGDAVPDET